MKDHTSYSNEINAQQAKVEEVKAAEALLPAEEQDPGKVNRAEAALAETAAVMPTLIVRIE